MICAWMFHSKSMPIDYGRTLLEGFSQRDSDPFDFSSSGSLALPVFSPDARFSTTTRAQVYSAEWRYTERTVAGRYVLLGLSTTSNSGSNAAFSSIDQNPRANVLRCDEPMEDQLTPLRLLGWNLRAMGEHSFFHIACRKSRDISLRLRIIECFNQSLFSNLLCLSRLRSSPTR
jgi:hypothetical protein